MTFRFNRDKRFGEFTYNEFMAFARDLEALIRARRREATFEILTYETTGIARKFPMADLSGDPAMETSDYFSYSLQGFTEDVWKRGIDVQFRAEDPNDKEPFVISVTCSRRPRMTRVYFWGQLVEEPLFAKIYAKFAQPDANTSIGKEVDRDSIIGTKKAKRVA